MNMSSLNLNVQYTLDQRHTGRVIMHVFKERRELNCDITAELFCFHV